MTQNSNYQKIAETNLRRFYENLPADAAVRLGADQSGRAFFFSAFGRRCRISSDGITLDEQPETGVRGVLVSLYALHADPAPCVVDPLKGFKDLPDSMPDTAAFAARTQQALVSQVPTIEQNVSRIIDAFSGNTAPADVGGDFSFLLYPLPKIALVYVFYREDPDFPASVTCLYSSNAERHLPTDALADLGEYTTKEILRLIG